MAFTKKTWVDRLVEFAGRRKITNVSTMQAQIVDVERAEGTVSQEGSAFSAQTMNDLEQRIADGFSSVENSVDQISSELNAKILELSPNTAITSISLEKNSTPQDLVIEQSGFYALTALNDRGTDTLMVAIFNANGDCLYSTTIFEATNYSQISTPILRLQAGNYKYRGAGGVINLIHYINQ